MTPDLNSIEVPGAAEAEERAARVVTAAFAESLPRHRTRRAARPIAAVAVAVVLIAAVLSPPGRAFVDHVRRAVGVDNAEPALFTLPAPGRLLVTAGSGTWIAYADGSRRLLGTYDDASWSPFGRYVAATAPTSSSRSTPREPFAGRWRDPASGSPAGRAAPPTRASPTSAATGSTSSQATAPATSWPATHPPPAFHPHGARASGSSSPTPTRTGACTRSSPRRVARSGARRRPARRSRSSGRATAGCCSSSHPAGSRSSTAPAAASIGSEAAPDVTAVAYRPGTTTYAELHRSAAGSRVTLGTRTLFSLAGELRGLTWSPDGRWLLVGSPASDQWVFIRADGRKIVAVSNISAQFHSPAFPEVEGWCCGT